MKKMIFTAAMALMVSTAAFAGKANSDKANTAEVSTVDFSFDVNANSVVRYLSLSEEQHDQMEYVFDRLDSDLRRIKYTKEEKRAERLQQALTYNLSAAHQCLNAEQYHKYLVLLNCTLKNKGLDFYFIQNNLSIAE